MRLVPDRFTQSACRDEIRFLRSYRLSEYGSTMKTASRLAGSVSLAFSLTR